VAILIVVAAKDAAQFPPITNLIRHATSKPRSGGRILQGADSSHCAHFDVTLLDHLSRKRTNLEPFWFLM